VFGEDSAARLLLHWVTPIYFLHYPDAKAEITSYKPTCRYRSACPNLDYFRIADDPAQALVNIAAHGTAGQNSSLSENMICRCNAAPLKAALIMIPPPGQSTQGMGLSRLTLLKRLKMSVRN
jgi:hypothetical protein